MKRKPLIFCAIDTADLGRARSLALSVGPVTGGLKLGLEFFSALGPEGIVEIQRSCPDAALFLDLKFHDIPNTAAAAIKALSERFRPAYINVHASGNPDMLRAARAACAPETKLLGVTVLTSMDEKYLNAVGQGNSCIEQVRRLAALSKECGLDGVVCSGHEIVEVRKACGENFVLMVPGIRPAGAGKGDQKRVMTPREAIAAGATHLVIGRPITEAADPAGAARAILDDLQ